MSRFLLVALGGGMGSVIRYAVVLWAAGILGTTFPFGTLLVNLVGSLLLGFVMHVSTATDLLSADARLALTTGVLGGFTTYSTFNFETTDFFRSGAWFYGTLNIVVTVVACLTAGMIGVTIARLIVGR